jgi:hypothetical protein
MVQDFDCPTNLPTMGKHLVYTARRERLLGSSSCHSKAGWLVGTDG